MGTVRDRSVAVSLIVCGMEHLGCSKIIVPDSALLAEVTLGKIAHLLRSRAVARSAVMVQLG
ncbi:Uncharacterised protein [Mycobacteroides abscessus subsp. abscessus]|nr:Uncharacterised protein [Mycobacteroides abscessus subsp. abscessus]SHS97777.1 Uncharacterised protein [Mycobacteroides abscessus subsp. abscessus]SHT21274.1 Uncharacterised protein [Mycobacteroides abscessus subsp. abscessus]SKF04622.1 Uncharacterised protein [Mycobacteroides abscessus subsp. abscessus]SKG71242.1 Uncharacterised protein [Mycobacteroides abscessus subsp. abscessus]